MAVSIATPSGIDDEMILDDWQETGMGDFDTSLATDAHVSEVVVQTCTMIQYTIIFGIAIGASYVTYKFLRIFF